MTRWNRTMTEVDHTHPDGDPCLGDAFCRGPRPVAADGGRRETGPERERDEAAETGDRPSDPEDGEPTMRDVSHTPPTGDGANDVFHRGSAGTDPAIPNRPDEGSDEATDGDDPV